MSGDFRKQLYFICLKVPRFLSKLPVSQELSFQMSDKLFIRDQPVYEILSRQTAGSLKAPEEIHTVAK